MKTIDAIEQRRSVKHFDPEHEMSEEEVNEILRLALLSPTSFNIQNWRLLVVKDKALRKKVRAAAWDQAQVTDASLLIILCADTLSWEKDTHRYWQNADKEVQDFMVPATKDFYQNKKQLQRDEAMRSSGIIAQTLMLTAKSMAYDSCPMIGFDADEVASLINLPDDYVIGMFVVIGKRTKDAWPRPGQLAMDEVVIENTF